MPARSSAFVLLVYFTWATSPPAPAADPDNVVGRVWELKVTDKAGQAILDGKFRTTKDHKVYQGGDEIGNWKKEKDKMTIHITKGKMEGTLELTQTRKGQTAAYSGHLSKADSSKNKAVIKVIDN